MESVEWIFRDHKLHLSMLQLLRAEQTLMSDSVPDDANQDDEISGMVLSPPPLDGMPHDHSSGSSTEWAVMKLSKINQDHVTLASEITRYCRLLRLHDAVMNTLTETEQWFVENHYDNGYPLSSLPNLPESPFQDLSRSTMSNYRKRLLQKAARFFTHLQGITEQH